MCKGAKIQRRIRLSSRKRVLERKTSAATEAVKAVSTVIRSEHLSFPLNGHLYTPLGEALKYTSVAYNHAIDQIGNSNYYPSPNVTFNFSVNKLPRF